MIELVEYTQGNIQFKIDSHRSVLESAKTVDGRDIAESDFSQIPALVQEAFIAVKDLSTRSEGEAKFKLSAAIIQWDEHIITPDTDLSALPEDILAFVNAIFPKLEDGSSDETAVTVRLYRNKQAQLALQNEDADNG